MTWSRFVKSPVGVTAWEVNYAGEEPKIQLGVGTAVAILSLDDAASLGGYLLSHAQKEDGE